MKNYLLAQKILNEGILIEDFWHLNRFPGKHSVEFEKKYYTVFRDRHGYPASVEAGVVNSLGLKEYENRK